MSRTTLVSGRDYLRIRDAARLLGVSEQTLRNWDRAGRLRAHRHPINGYRLYKVGDLRDLLGQVARLPEMHALNNQLSLTLEVAGASLPNEPVETMDELPPCHWTPGVALDPKHRPQVWDAPASTVRRDWRKFPQEAHILDIHAQRYRRLTVDEIALIQGFDPTVVTLERLTERQRIAALGDAVPPPLARAVLQAIASEHDWKRATAVEICAGAGGMAEGATAAGLEHRLLIDASEACTAILRNHRPWGPDRVIHGDVRDFPFAGLRRVGLLSGGPPCQPWSLSGSRRGHADDRDLLGAMPDLVAKLEPEVFLFENVPGLATFEDGAYLAHLVGRLRTPSDSLRYGVLVGQLNAADFGVAQVRKRLFILGLRDEPAAAVYRCFDRAEASATHRDPSLPKSGLPAWRTLGDVLKDRPDPGGWRRWISEIDFD